MHLLVTGHQGYIGTVLVPMLLEQGHTVVGMDTNLFRQCNFGIPPKDVPEIKKDIRDVQAADLEGFHAIIHLAALTNDPFGNLNADLTFDINYFASVKIARLAKQVGISRYLFSSSCSIYGAAGDDYIDEWGEYNPITPYGYSKELVEREVSKLADDNFSPTFLRNMTAYGVSPRIRFDLVLNSMVAWAVTTGRVYIKSDGTPWRSIVHVEDIARAFISILHAPRELVHNRSFNVGTTEENYRVSELAEIVAQTIPGSHIFYASDGGPDRSNYRVNCDRIKKELPEFKPEWNAQHGARQLFEAYISVGLSADEIEGPNFKRISHIKQLINQGLLNESLYWKLGGQKKKNKL